MDLTSTMLAPIGAYITHNLPIAFSAIAVLVLTFTFIAYVISASKKAILGTGGDEGRDWHYEESDSGSLYAVSNDDPSDRVLVD